MTQPFRAPTRPVQACGCDALVPDLISLDHALQRIQTLIPPLQGTETVPLAQAKGRVLSAAVTARSAMPRFDHSAMDGYALRLSDLQGQGPWVLPVALTQPAGTPADAILPFGQAARILTGAPLPPGADSVVMQEAVQVHENRIVLSSAPQPGQNIRRKAEEYPAGATLAPAGARVTARMVGALAAGGHGWVDVRPRLRVSVLITGAEIAEPGTDALRPAQIHDANGPMLAALLARPDMTLIALRPVADTLQATVTALQHAASVSDLVITTGGVSVGDADHLHAAVRQLGQQSVFVGVAIKPGKPVSLGRLPGAVWLGLPGNPQSAFVTWTLFGTALVSQMLGQGGQGPARRIGVLSAPLSHKPGRCELRAASITGADGAGRMRLNPVRATHLGQMSGLSGADALILIPAEVETLPEAALIDYIPLSQTEFAP